MARRELGEVVSVRRKRGGVVHGFERVEQEGRVLSGWGLCSSSGVYGAGDIVKTPVTCKHCRRLLQSAGRAVETREFAELLASLNLAASTEVTDLGFGTRVTNGLRHRGGYRTVEALLKVSDRDLLDIQYFGSGMLADAIETLRVRKGLAR
jgi:DNA-directed RNA polymerase alpha subunit